MRRFIISVISLLYLIASPVRAAFEANNTTLTFSDQPVLFVPVDQAFIFSSLQQNDHLTLEWAIKPGYYLYQHQFKITGQNVTIKADIPPGTPHHDEYFGDVFIYKEPLTIDVALSSAGENASVTVIYQGCAEAGFCYPPEQRVVTLAPVIAQSDDDSSSTITQSEQQQLADSLAANSWSLALFFLLGAGLAFTPCVFPMYPIITGIVLGNHHSSKSRTLWLSFTYVQGMAITYSILGLIVASAGLKFQAVLQSPAILIAISALFILLSLSMFGLYNLQMPASLQTRLVSWSAKQKGGASVSVFLMGAISGLICSPCTTAPLSGALLYVAQSGDLVTGASALYLLSLGMGVPLIAISLFGHHVLPRAGIWMDKIKTLFGFVLLAAPIFLLERIIPGWLSAVLWAVLGVTAFAWLYWQKNILPFGGWKQTSLGIIAVLGMLASVKPLLPLAVGQSPVIQVQSEAGTARLSQSTMQQAAFIPVRSLEELTRELSFARQQQKPVLLDFYADWCVACKEFEYQTFSDPDVANTLHKFRLLRADVTKNREQDSTLLNYLDVFGLPTLVFWDAQGKRIDSARITGFMDAETFLMHIQQPALYNR